MYYNNTMNFFDQTKSVYNTQGELVEKSQQQLFSDKFQKYLKNPTTAKQPVYPDYINNCNPPCCNQNNYDLISSKIINVNYLNKNVCPISNKNYRIG